MNDFDWVHSKVKQLDKLLDDPEPGLFTWCECYATLMQDIAEFWRGERVIENEKTT